MDDLFYVVYVMFATGGTSTGCILFVFGCVLIVFSIMAALVMALTARGSRERMNEKMQERY